MKLLVVSQYYWPEPFRINDICDGLVERGHDITVLTSVPNIPKGKFYDGYGWFKRGDKTHNGIKIERVGVFERRNGGAFRLFLNCASFAINSLFHIPKLKKNNFDAVFVFNNSPVSKLLPANIIAMQKKIPNIVFILDIWPESMFLLLGMKESEKLTLFKRISYGVSRWLYKGATSILISSTGFENKLRNMGLTCPIGYFPNYAEKLNETDFTINRTEFGLSSSDFVIGFAGNIGTAQGLDKVVSAARSVSGVKWLVVGDGTGLAGLKTDIENSGLSDSFILTGWVDSGKVPAYLNICDALLVSLKDSEVLNLTVPAKLQTYMSAGKPVIAFMNGAGADVVRQSGCGVVAAAEDPAALKDAVEMMRAQSPENLAEMGRKGREFCAENFDREKLLDFLDRHIVEQIELTR